MPADEITRARTAWLKTRDGETGDEFAALLVDRGLYSDAELIYAQLEADGYIIAWWGRAWSARERGDDVAAEQYLREYIARDDGDSPEASAYLGIWLHSRDAGGYTEELLRIGAAVNQDARGSLGNLLRKTGRLTEAEEVLRVGYELGEEASHIPLALVLEAAGRVSEAVPVLREGYEMGDTFCAFNLGLLLEEEGLELAAIDWYVKAARGGDLKAVDLLDERGIEIPVT
ncbi:tetratricopeptide repeat protein [Conyzicola sp.]|uniref:tetratricopeptide repeat protein n=1 Tax=Conyzicola sp. TaxID=1969404 RepID=UPI003988F42F